MHKTSLVNMLSNHTKKHLGTALDCSVNHYPIFCGPSGYLDAGRIRRKGRQGKTRKSNIMPRPVALVECEMCARTWSPFKDKIVHD